MVTILSVSIKNDNWKQKVLSGIYLQILVTGIVQTIMNDEVFLTSVAGQTNQ